MVLIVILVLLCLVLILPAQIEFRYENKYSIKLNFLFFRLSFPKKQKKSEISKNISSEKKEDIKLKKLFDKSSDIISVTLRFLKNKTKIENLYFKYTFGFNDAAITGIFSGVVYSLVYTFTAFVEENFNLKNKTISINPDFDNLVQNTEFGFSISSRLIYIFIFGIKFIKIWLK